MTTSSLNPERPPRDTLSSRESASTATPGGREGRGAQNASEGPSRALRGSKAAQLASDTALLAGLEAEHARLTEGARISQIPECRIALSSMAAGIHTAIVHLRRTTPDGPASSADAADNSTDAPDNPVEQMARALAGAAVLNPKRNALAWHTLGEAGRERFREQARRIIGQPTPDSARTTPNNPPASGDAADDELTTEEARTEVERLAGELYQAEDRVAFVREMCALRERKQQASRGQGEVQTGEVLAWLQGPKCGRQMGAEPQPATTNGLREQYAAAIASAGGSVDLMGAADAVLAVRDTRVEELTAELGELGELQATIARVRKALDDAAWGGPDRADVIDEITAALDPQAKP